MSDEECFVTYKPSFGERIARFLGYRFELGEEPGDWEQLSAGWARTTLRLRFSILGRLRLLFSGRLKIDLTHYADAPINTMKNRMDIRIYAPWESGHD